MNIHVDIMKFVLLPLDLVINPHEMNMFETKVLKIDGDSVCKLPVEALKL